MSLVQVLIIAVIIPIVVPCVLRGFLKRDGDDEDSVHMPKGLLLAGAIGIIVCLILTVLSMVLQFGVVWNAVLFFGFLLALVCILAYYSINIRYDSETFCCRRFFCTKTYRYTDIQGVIPGSGSEYTLVMDVGKVRVDGMAVNGQQFLYYAEDRYREAGLGFLPDIPHMLFHGYVVNPWSKVILTCFPVIGLGALAVYFTLQLFSVEMPENLVKETMVLTVLSEQDSEFLIASSGGKILQIDSDAIMNADELESLISQKQELSIEYCPIDESTMEIWGISSQGAVYTTPKTVYETKRNVEKKNVGFLWAATTFYGGCAVFFFYILSHAEKYPRMAALLVKEEDLNI